MSKKLTMYDGQKRSSFDAVAEISVPSIGSDRIAGSLPQITRPRVNDLTRGERNRNPGNIKRNGTAWQGLELDHSSDDDFCVFTDILYGVRALAKTLLSYQRTHGLKTLREIVHYWAETKHVDTTPYVSICAALVGYAPDAEIDLEHQAILTALVRAIIQRENGRVTCRDVVPEAVRLALA
jgi:hypothetical protein